jgi:ubiquinone/menaquinone biosynthesis C-methylase UbiE
MHRFNPEKMYKLDNEERRAFLNAEEIWRMAGLQKGMDAADIGCGIGFFTFAAAAITGDTGAVYALDLESAMLDELSRRITARGCQNIKTLLTEAYDLKLPEKTADIAFIAFVLHEVEDKPRFLAEAARILKPQGTLCILEWKKADTQKGPGIGQRISEQETEGFLADAGFIDLHSNEYNIQTYLTLAKKSR